MEIRKSNSKPTRVRQSERGFSLLEIMMVVALLLVMGSITFMSLIPALKAQRVVNAYNTTLSAMRQARDNAVSQRSSYSVTFASSAGVNTITVAPTLTGGFQGQQTTAVYNLPKDISFYADPVLASTTPPDGYGTGLLAIDFGYTANGSTGGQSTIYFCPDGSAQDSENGAGNCIGSVDGGVVYIARSGETLSSRAITLWGGTGRVRGWRLYPKSGGGYQWVRQ